VAWTGIVISILATIIICEFFYMPFKAVPAWHHTEWGTTMDVGNRTTFPATVVAWAGETSNSAGFNRPSCSFQPNTGPAEECFASQVRSYNAARSIGQYVVFNSTNQTFDVINDSKDGAADSFLNLLFNMTC
jgi:hypothetical protein